MDIDEDKGGLVEEGEFKSYCKRKGTFGILSLLNVWRRGRRRI